MLVIHFEERRGSSVSPMEGQYLEFVTLMVSFLQQRCIPSDQFWTRYQYFQSEFLLPGILIDLEVLQHVAQDFVVYFPAFLRFIKDIDVGITRIPSSVLEADA